MRLFDNGIHVEVFKRTEAAVQMNAFFSKPGFDFVHVATVIQIVDNVSIFKTFDIRKVYLFTAVDKTDFLQSLDDFAGKFGVGALSFRSFLR